VYPGEPGTFSDAITVYPDHVCARIGVLAALALLVRREHTGCGGSVSVAQSEVMLSHQAADIAARALAARSQAASSKTTPDSEGQPGRDAPWGLFPAAGDDDWIAVTVRGDADWAALGQVIGRPDLLADPALATPGGRDAARARIEGAVGQWTAQHPAADAMELLQAAGVPAGAMLRADDLLRWEYHRARRSFRQEIHPHGVEPYVMENIQLHDEHTAAPPDGQAPLLGEQTAQIAAGLLGLSPAAITALIERGVLEVPPVSAGGQTASDTRKASR
jgi:crotonobetainyl-CoA:carnitine CoA-transferase CaiB-like acyl-CoA transferase